MFRRKLPDDAAAALPNGWVRQLSRKVNRPWSTPQDVDSSGVQTSCKTPDLKSTEIQNVWAFRVHPDTAPDSPSPPSDGGEGWGEEVLKKSIPCRQAPSADVRRQRFA
jgi:hypothetical protein